MFTLFRRRSLAAYVYGHVLNSHKVHTSTAPLLQETGLYGFNHLKTPKGFRRFVEDAIERSNELVTFISGMPSAPEIIGAMDEISDTVCSVIDSAELCRATHPDREFVEEASEASLRINEYIHHLNTNHCLYMAVVKAEQDSHLLNEEAQRVAHHLRLDLEKAGIHLPSEQLDRANQLNMEIVQLCREFNENIINDPGHMDIFPASHIPKKLHHLARPIYRTTSGAFGGSAWSMTNMKEKGFRLPTDPNTLSSILQWVSDAEIRKTAYIQGNSAPLGNLGVLDKLIAARHEFAQIMGHSSYADLAVHSSMASSPDVVLSFLLEMSEIVRPRADEEFKTIWNFKRERSGQLYGDLEPWDETYFTAIMKSAAYDLDSSVVASFFPLSQCLEGLKVLAESLFGVTFHHIPLAPGESWHPDVIKVALHHPDEGDLGYLYLDLKSRKNKHPVCAHFAIKGGRRLSETDYQLPIVALVCNFLGSKPASLLNHWEVETLFHEFGHALHSLLSRTDYQHFSGTRVVIDFAETPSNLFQYYAWDFRILKTFARHYSTGDVIPEDLVKSMRGAKDMFSGTELQRQIFYALIDQKLFGEEASSMRDTASLVAELKRQHTSWKHVDGTHWHTRFGHLASYGAGYYSYLYAKCFAATIWQKICEEDPLSLAAGSAIRHKFLQHGGAKDPGDILNDLVGKRILNSRYGGIVPDITSLSHEMELKN
ncbi:mitochondrial intermediate peptidase, mitochondrial-like isoform X2 [Coffea arabica]|uniref:Mitochondrial intermediate peptidase, mitochondrial-like isoform X2 n=1 Tax=Coffea arabica TaxID=13443 RepID=A0A6P6VLL2_COFAR|nr:mitochondrial intermediate peptidase, mitochondrial-like isoform X1 [Coffea arabica]